MSREARRRRVDAHSFFKFVIRRFQLTAFASTVPPVGLSAQEVVEWEKNLAEQTYQAKLERRLERARWMMPMNANPKLKNGIDVDVGTTRGAIW